MALRTVSVHGDGTHPVRLELADDTIGAALGTAEYERLSVVLNQLGGDRHPVRPVHLPEVMDHITLRLLGGLNGNPHRITLVVANNRLHLPADGGREEENLAVLCCLVEQSAHCGKESHVRHTVGLVEHHGRDIVEADVPALNQVFESSWASDHDVDALVKGAHLVAVAGATEDGDDPLAVVPQKIPDDVMDLGGQLACRDKDQRTRLTGSRLHGADDERDTEGKRLSRTSGCLTADVPAGERWRNRF